MSIEEEVVSLAIKGDEGAFAELYNEHFDKIYRYVYLRLGNLTAAEDLTQEVFVKALEAIGSYKWRNLPFSSWLFRIAHNQVIDHLRKESKWEKQSWDDNIRVDDHNPEDIAERKLEAEELNENVKKLSPAQREVISLRFTSELSIAQVARVMGKSQGAVKALQHSAILALRKVLSAG